MTRHVEELFTAPGINSTGKEFCWSFSVFLYRSWFDNIHCISSNDKFLGSPFSGRISVKRPPNTASLLLSSSEPTRPASSPSNIHKTSRPAIHLKDADVAT